MKDWIVEKLFGGFTAIAILLNMLITGVILYALFIGLQYLHYIIFVK